MPLSDYLNPDKLKSIQKDNLQVGDVISMQLDDAPYPKMCVITGICKDKICATTVYINSEIHRCIRNKPQFYAQYPLKKKDSYTFLRYDSFVHCGFSKFHEIEKIFDFINKNIYEIKGRIDDDDLKLIRQQILETGTLSDEEIEMYFYDLIQN